VVSAHGDDRRGLLLRPTGLGAAPPCGDGLAGMVLVSSGPAEQPGDGQGDHHGPGESDADPAGELVDLAPAGTGGIAEQDMAAAQTVAATPVQRAKVR
jgi:hypothetical protein